MFKVKENHQQQPVSDLVRERLESFVSKDSKREYALKKLKLSVETERLIKENTSTDTDEKNVARTSLPVASTSAIDDTSSFLTPATPSASPQQNKDREQKILDYLPKLEGLRNDNSLVYGFKKTENWQQLLLSVRRFGLGLEAADKESDVSCYKKEFFSTDASTYFGPDFLKQLGAVEFGITYDNKIFLLPKEEDAEFITNLKILTYGTFLKAAGCIQIGTIEKQIEDIEGSYQTVTEGQINYISVYNSSFTVPIENIAISLFVLQKLGIDLNVTKVVIPNEQDQFISKDYPDCRINIRGKMKDAAYYLDELRFPGAKAKAEKTQGILDKITEIFLSIDDEILSKHNKKIIQKMEKDKVTLKLNIIKFLLHTQFGKNKEKENVKPTILSVPTVENDGTDIQTKVKQDVASSINRSSINDEERLEQFNGIGRAINESIGLFGKNNIDLSFLDQEVNYLLAYTLQNGLTLKERDVLQEWSRLVITIPSRVLNIENISPFISFYDHNPINTLLALLKNYTKGDGLPGIIKRFFSFAWNRHNVNTVNKFLSSELPDNLTSYAIFEELRKLDPSLSLASKESTLIKRILFCAQLNAEEEPSQFSHPIPSRSASLAAINESVNVVDIQTLQRLSAVAEKLVVHSDLIPKSSVSPSLSPSHSSASINRAINATKLDSSENISEIKQHQDELKTQLRMRSRSDSQGSKRGSSPPPVFFVRSSDDVSINRQEQSINQDPLQTLHF